MTLSPRAGYKWLKTYASKKEFTFYKALPYSPGSWG